MAEFWTCEGCYDLTENQPDHRGVVLCTSCGGPAVGGGFIVTVLGDSGVRSLTRAESLTPESLKTLVAGLSGTETVLAISTPHSIMVDLARDGQPVPDPYWFERQWLAQIGREDLLPADAWGEAAA